MEPPPPAYPLRFISVLKQKSILLPVAQSPSSSHFTHFLSCPPSFPQAHIAKTPITSHDIELRVTLRSPYSRISDPLLALFQVRDSSQLLLCGPWVSGFLCVPTLNSCCAVYTVLVVLFLHTTGDLWMNGKRRYSNTSALLAPIRFGQWKENDMKFVCCDFYRLFVKLYHT